jgi:dihydroxyacetone kinase
MMTSLDMRGFSVSVCPIDGDQEQLLTQPCPMSAWPGCKVLGDVVTVDLPDGLTPIKPLPSKHADTEEFLRVCCEILVAAEGDLNHLDAQSGDGDTGSTLAGAARALIDSMDELPLADHTQLFRAIGQELSQTMGGSSGVLLAIFFAAAGDAASSGMTKTDALKAGLKRMQEIGGAKPGDRTMIDALLPALDALGGGMAAAAVAARRGANHTATLSRANAGRAAYISAERLQGHIDPGAEAIARLFEQLDEKKPHLLTVR